MLTHAFRFVERVNFVVGAGNIRSRRAMEKIGGKLTDFHEVRALAGKPVPHVCYRISRDDFAKGCWLGHKPENQVALCRFEILFKQSCCGHSFTSVSVRAASPSLPAEEPSGKR